MAVNWTTFEAAAESELDGKAAARSEDITADLWTGITTYYTKIQDYVADQAAARTSLIALLTAIGADITADGDLPSAVEVGALVPSADLALILGAVEDEYEAGVVKTVDDLIDDKIPNMPAV